MYESTFYATRQPLLPVNQLFEFYSIIKSHNEQYVLDYLIEKFTVNYQLEEALYLASDTLYHEVVKYKSMSSVFSDKDKKRMLHSLAKYYIRASSRATPFGLFANFREGGFDFEKDNDFTDQLDYYPKLDMEVLFQIGECLSGTEGVKNHLILYNNTSLYKTKDDFRYIEYRLRKGLRTHHLVSIASDELLNFIIKISKKGIKYDTLIVEILNQYDVVQEDVEAHVDNLISCKLLVTNLDVNITGLDYVDVLYDFVSKISDEVTDGKIVQLKNILQDIKSLLLQVDNKQSNISSYRKIYELLRDVLPNIPEKNLIQLDVVSQQIDDTLHSGVRADLGKLLSVFSTFSKSYSTQYSQLEIFKRAFSERYDDRRVKLTEALDEEIGIGYKSAISTKDIYDPKITGKTKFTKFVLKKYHDYLKQNKKQIEITDWDIKESFGNTNIDNSCPGFTYLINAYPKKEGLLLHAISYSPVITGLSGRFCGAHQQFYEKLNNLNDRIEDQYDNYIYAEIIHLPQARVGNVIARPYFGKYEIPFLANSRLPEEQKIFVDDLYIQMINNELFLFSEKLNKPIRPRLSNAHNYRKNGIPIYHFLSDMQFQNFDSQMIWDWGILKDVEEYLPRVVYKDIIIEQAYWIIKDHHFAALKKTKNFIQFKMSLAEIKHKLHFDDSIVFKESDNVLYIDLSTDLGIELFRKYVNKNEKQIVLYESLVDKTYGESLPRYNKELVVPFVKKTNKKAFPLKIVSPSKDTVPRTFIPGSEWIYFKVYIGHKFSNKLLVVIGDYIENKLVSKGLVGKWFFIRYSDPKQHLRIRIYIRDTSLVSSVVVGISTIFSKYIKLGKIAGVVQDTYHRELERYKNKNIIESEALFYHDSRLVYNLYKSFGEINYNQLFFAAYFIVEEYLETLNLDHLEKFKFLERNFKNFAKEFDYERNKTLRNSLHEELRKIKDITFTEALDTKMINIISKSEIKNILLTIKGNVKDDYFSMLGSYIHMSVNRLFSDKQRLNEFRIYFFLYKKYQSIIAREAKS
ncbi:lantibiotic dehydratase [Chryseobacterium polytrichastri]|uniref:Thiopeptide-type bacteriocin biosynthesis domain-containing protein n=1 Tax=Chryseobacterium polytrichastri TaxID=1302687 RepID=A0A1M6X225_9FLAO|nr:lantibiotic dehydratase [Chryseobacterium polytrichastri]SHL00072.1 thiopeptide-type bacteriocin biosynthesis domain-containing protein [Chryseobacterium polytrichastri]